MADWQVGDLAVCVDAAPRWYTVDIPGESLELNRIYTVCGFSFWSDGTLNLLFEEFSHPTGAGIRADRFRKVVRDKHEACEEEFVTLLNRTKRKVSA
jgi:hypothetical protein